MRHPRRRGAGQDPSMVSPTPGRPRPPGIPAGPVRRTGRSAPGRCPGWAERKSHGGRERDPGGIGHRVAVRPGADGWERHRLDAALAGQTQAVPVGAGQELGLAVLPVPIDRSDGMDHPPGGQTPAAGDARFPRRAAADLATLLQDLGAAGPVNRAIHAAPAQEAGIGGVHDGLGILLGDVALDELQPWMCRSSRFAWRTPSISKFEFRNSKLRGYLIHFCCSRARSPFSLARSIQRLT